MNKIKDYWSKTHKRGDGFDSGFERIIYSVLQSNTTDLGKPNSCMVGADLFFESPLGVMTACAICSAQSLLSTVVVGEGNALSLSGLGAGVHGNSARSAICVDVTP